MESLHRPARVLFVRKASHAHHHRCQSCTAPRAAAPPPLSLSYSIALFLVFISGPPPFPAFLSRFPHPTHQLETQSMTRPLGALAALFSLGASLGLAQGQHAPRHSPRRHLQTGAAGTPVYVEMTQGNAILALQEDSAALVVSIISSS